MSPNCPQGWEGWGDKGWGFKVGSCSETRPDFGGELRFLSPQKLGTLGWHWVTLGGTGGPHTGRSQGMRALKPARILGFPGRVW